MFQHQQFGGPDTPIDQNPGPGSHRFSHLLNAIDCHLARLTDLLEYRHGAGLPLLSDPLPGESIARIRADQRELIDMLREAVAAADS